MTMEKNISATLHILPTKAAARAFSEERVTHASKQVNPLILPDKIFFSSPVRPTPIREWAEKMKIMIFDSVATRVDVSRESD